MSAAHTPVNGDSLIEYMTFREHYAGLAMQGIVAGFPRSANEPDRSSNLAPPLLPAVALHHKISYASLHRGASTSEAGGHVG